MGWEGRKVQHGWWEGEEKGWSLNAETETETRIFNRGRGI